MKRFDDAFEAWSKLRPDEKKSKFKPLGETLANQFIAAKKYRFASRVAGDIAEDDGGTPVIGQINNGGFESGVKLRNAGLFEWQIGEGTEPQIGLNEEQKNGNGNSEP